MARSKVLQWKLAWKRRWQFDIIGLRVTSSKGLRWKSAWRRRWVLLTKWHCRFWDQGALQLIAQKAHYNTFISSLLWLEAKYCNEKWHEEESGNLTLLLLGHFARNVCNRVCGAPKHTYFCGLTRRAVAVSFLLHEINWECSSCRLVSTVTVFAW